MTLLQDVTNAYLSPLLKKHSSGSSLTYEDLTNSMEAAQLVLSECPNEFVLKRLQSLHNSQVQAYKASAKFQLEQWAQQSPPLPFVGKGETTAAYVTRCYSLLKSTRPKWQVDDSELEACVYKTLLRRATEAYNKQQPSQSSSSTAFAQQPQSILQAQAKKPETTLAGHKRGLSSASNDSTVDEEAEVDEEEDGEMAEDDNNREEEEDGEEDEDGEVGEDDNGDEEMSQPGGDGNVETATTASATTTKAANGSSNNNNSNNNNKRKKQPQQQGRNTKKRVIKKKSTIQKKGPPGGNQKANATTKKVVTRKKPQGKKGRAANNNKNGAANNNKNA